MRALELLVTALTNDALLEPVADEALKIRTLGTLVHCLLQFLKGKSNTHFHPDRCLFC